MVVERATSEHSWGRSVSRWAGARSLRIASHRKFVSGPSEEYVVTIQTTTREMAEETPAVVEWLAKGLLRGLGVDRRFLPYGDPSEINLRGQGH
jgi:hypothetical protein